METSQPSTPKAQRVSAVLAQQIRAYRVAKGWTQEQLAHAMREADPEPERRKAFQTPTIAKIELGTRAVKIDEAVAFAVVLDVPLPLLLLPLETGGEVELTADTTANAYRAFEWMASAEPLPGRIEPATIAGVSLGFARLKAYRRVTRRHAAAGAATQPVRDLLPWGYDELGTGFREALPAGADDVVERTKIDAAPALNDLADEVAAFMQLGGAADVIVDPVILGLMEELGIGPVTWAARRPSRNF